MSDFIGRLSFKSIFSDELYKFVAEKRGLGLKYEVGARVLSSFDSFVFSQGYNQKDLSKEIMDSWINLNPNQKSRTLWLKLVILRDFGRFMLRMGLPAYANFMLPKKAHDFSPYIFTDDELERLFRAADNLVPLSPKRHKHLVMPMLLRLLYYCGLRLSEATQLCVGDVDILKPSLRSQFLYWMPSASSIPCKAMFASRGDMMEPCPLPVSVSRKTLLSTYPDFNHFPITSLCGKPFTISIICSWLRLSKQPLKSPSNIHCFFPCTHDLKILSMAS